MIAEEFLDALLSLPQIRTVHVSRDGRWVAWSWFNVGPAADVFVAPTDGSAPPVRLTDTPDNTLVASWTPDNRSLIVRQDRDGNERAQLFRIDRDRPMKLVPLTEPEPNYFIRGGTLHPNGRWLVYGANVDQATGAEIDPTWIYRHDLETGERLPIARPERGGFVHPSLSPSGDYVLYSRMDRHPAGRQIWLVDIDGTEDREILNFGPDVKCDASWLPDGRRVLVQAETTRHRRVGMWEMASGQVTWLLDDPARNIEDAYVPYGSEAIVLLEMQDAGVRPSLLGIESGLEQPLPVLPGNFVPLAPGQGEAWTGLCYSSRQPADVISFSPDSLLPGQFISLSRVWERTGLQPSDLAPAENFHWTSGDGTAIHGWLYRPDGRARGTIVYVHGGPTAHSQDQVNSLIQYLVYCGFNVLDPNYRGSTGYGLPFREAIKEDGWGGREQDDIRAGVEALIEAGIAEAGRIGITGTSYGGYTSWCAITRFPHQIIAAAAPVCGMTDLVVDYKTTRPDLRPYSEEMLGGRPDEVPQRYHDRSPINFLDHIQGRLLIVQGMQDPNVTPENVRVVTTRLDRLNVEYDLLTFEDEGHGILNPNNQKRLYRRLVDFFAEAFGTS